MIAQLRAQLSTIVLFAVIGLVVGALPLIIRLWRRWREERAARPPSASTSLARRDGNKRPDGLRADQLLKIWRRFLAAQPWRYRASIADYPSVIVFGAAGAGKSLLIDTQVDWAAQQQRFFPSATDDPLLQIYLGGKVTVQEVSPALLGDDSPSARRALSRLWRAWSGRRAPNVVVVLDGEQLGRVSSAELRRQAQLVRGKLHLLQEIHRRPARVSVCLTHMDAVEGFAELQRVCKRHQLSSALELARFAGEGEAAPLFAPHEPHLPLALTSLPSAGYCRLVELFADAGQAGAALASFLVPLTEPSPLSAPPALDRLFLFAPDPELQVDRVFAAALAPQPTARRRIHLVRCAAAASGLALWVGGAHWHHARKLARAEAAVAELAQRAAPPTSQSPRSQFPTSQFPTSQLPSPWPSTSQSSSLSPSETPSDGAPIDLPGALDRADRALADVRSAERWWPLLRWSARPQKHALAQSLVESVRAAYLVPALEQCQGECREVGLYGLGVLYAAPDDALGRLVGDHLRHFAANLGVPESAVASYLRWTERPWRQTPSLALLARLLSGGDLAGSEKPWRDFLDELEAAYDSADVTGRLADLQSRAQALAATLERSRTFVHVPALERLLADAAPPEVASLVRAPRRQETLAWLTRNAGPVEGLLAMVQKGDPSAAQLGQMTAAAFVAHVDALLRDGGSERYVIELGRRYAFARPRWLELVARASVRAYVQKPGYPFLPRAGAGGEPAADLVPDLYRRVVVEGSIKPALDEFGKRLGASPLPASDRSALAAYVLDQMSLYAQRYRDALLSVETFHLDVRTSAELHGAIAEMTQPSGGLQRWLRRIAEDADLGALETPYLRPLGDAVAPLAPLVRLVKPGRDAGPGPLGRYVALVGKLARELAGVERDPNATGGVALAALGTPPLPGASAPPAEESEGLARVLSPVGRVSAAMLLEPEQSYLAQVKVWLDEVGLSGELRRPFVEPFDRVLDFGVPEIEAALAAQWNRQWNAVSPMFAKYPFRRGARRDVAPEELDALRFGGPFWTSFRAMLAPFCVARGTTWSARAPLVRPVRLPSGMLARVNLVARLARIFWDKEGKRAPLELSVTALPLPKDLGADGYVTMSFLRAGGASVFGFNQRPMSRTFAPAWWSSEGASMGVSFGDGAFKAAPDRSIDVAESSWSFYRLLERARSSDEVVAWVIPDGFRHRAVTLRFVVHGDPVALRPWTLFNNSRGEP
ncbi:MAG TPA: hypothetical protein VFF06_20950 [Polyangia bacterium]|nr:hypothetical protein [Polyangia bacterium]